MEEQLTPEQLARILQAEDIAGISFHELVELFRKEADITRFAPDGLCQIDPRNGERILFNRSRAKRPHDNARGKPSSESAGRGPCLVCAGRTTGVVDVAPLSDGFTFINKNLYPILYPAGMDGLPLQPEEDPTTALGIRSYGLHFLQWTSSLHSRDWHNLAQADRVKVVERQARLEGALLRGARGAMPCASAWGGPEDCFGFFSMIKNCGAQVGGSLDHGHQQMAFSNIMPRLYRDNLRFLRRHGEFFSAYLLRENPPELIIRDYGAAVLLVPYFMRRPCDMVLVMRNQSKRYLHELDEFELAAWADGWRDGILAMKGVLAQMGRPLAYNVVAHLGPGAGLYAEFLPYSQERGGFEQIGLYVCQSHPRMAADQIREALASGGQPG